MHCPCNGECILDLHHELDLIQAVETKVPGKG